MAARGDRTTGVEAGTTITAARWEGAARPGIGSATATAPGGYNGE